MSGMTGLYDPRPRGYGQDPRFSGEPYDIVPRLTQVAQAVMPQDYDLIFEDVCPMAKAPGKQFKYTTFKWDEFFDVPDTRIGRVGAAPRVSFGSDDTEGECVNHGIEDEVPREDTQVANAHQTNFEPYDVAVEGVTGLMLLAREKRVATLLTTTSSYDAALRMPLSGGSMWSAPATSSPVKVIRAAAAKMMVRPNIFVCGKDVWTHLSQHPELVEAVTHSGAGKVNAAGVVSREAAATVLEVDRVVVGDAWHSTAKEGQADRMLKRVWGNNAMLLRSVPIMGPRDRRPSFASTFQWRQRAVGAYYDPRPGLDGCDIVKVVESVLETVRFKGAGYLWTNVVPAA